MKYVLSIMAVVLCLIFFTHEVFADDKFSTNFDLVYRIANNGTAIANYNYRLTNLTSKFIPSEYIAEIKTKEIFNLKAYDRNGALVIENLGSDKETTKIRIKFNGDSSGIGKVYNWTLSYETLEIAKKVGENWQVNIPRPSDYDNVSDFSIWVFTPDSFGKVGIAKPKANLLGNVWTKKDVPKGGINLFYTKSDGPLFQKYDFRLRYHLVNKNIFPISSEITVPFDTASQKIILNSIVPRPLNIRVDGDGNWMAKYEVGPLLKVDIVASGSAVVFVNSQYKETNFVLANYLKPLKFWEADNSQIVELARQLRTPEAIYSFVKDEINIDKEFAANYVRSGGTKVLSLKKAVNSFDFADLFISIARAAGIACREVFGYSISSGFAVWTQYYDPESLRWIMVDSALANSSGWDYFSEFDVNHLAFAIRGTESELPIPVGAYNDKNDKNDVEISFGDSNMIIPATKYGVRANFDQKLIAGFDYATFIYIDNFGPTAMEFDDIEVLSNKLSISIDKINGPLVIPPLGSLKVPVRILPTAFNEQFSDIILVRFKGEEKSYNVLVEPLYKSPVLIILVLLFTFGILSIIAQIARSLSLQKQKRGSNLRG